MAHGPKVRIGLLAAGLMLLAAAFWLMAVRATEDWTAAYLTGVAGQPAGPAGPPFHLLVLLAGVALVALSGRLFYGAFLCTQMVAALLFHPYSDSSHLLPLLAAGGGLWLAFLASWAWARQLPEINLIGVVAILFAVPALALVSLMQDAGPDRLLSLALERPAGELREVVEEYRIRHGAPPSGEFDRAGLYELLAGSGRVAWLCPDCPGSLPLKVAYAGDGQRWQASIARSDGRPGRLTVGSEAARKGTGGE